MSDQLTFTLHSPITEEEWDAITDVDFDHTDNIFFHTKHGKTVEFVKVVRCKDCVHRKEDSGGDWCECTGCDVNPNGFCEEGSRDENQNN